MKLGRWGLVVTFMYLPAVFWLANQGEKRIIDLNPNELGDFLAGTVGPLAFFWLVLGFFQQSAELRNSVAALELQTRELKASVEQQSALVRVTEEQHKLDLKVMEQKAEVERDQSVPRFTLKFAGGSGGKTQTYKFQLENQQAEAEAVVMTLKDSSGKLTPSAQRDIKRGQRFEIVIVTQTPETLASGGILEVKSTSVNGLSRLQEFMLEGPDRGRRIVDQILS